MCRNIKMLFNLRHMDRWCVALALWGASLSFAAGKLAETDPDKSVRSDAARAAAIFNR